MGQILFYPLWIKAFSCLQIPNLSKINSITSTGCAEELNCLKVRVTSSSLVMVFSHTKYGKSNNTKQTQTEHFAITLLIDIHICDTH